MPLTRKRAASIIIIHDSDSDGPEIHKCNSIKRHKGISESGAGPSKTSVERYHQDGKTTGIDGESTTKKNLKGRKRFTADLADMRNACEGNFQVDGLRVKNLRPGDDEGSIKFIILTQDLDRIVEMNLLVSDASEYPNHHAYFSFSSDSDTPPHILSAMENALTITGEKSPDIRGAVEKLLNVLAMCLHGGMHVQSQNKTGGEEEWNGEVEDDDGENYDAYNELDDFGLSASRNDLDLVTLQRDFVEIVATGYRPGLIRFGQNDFCLSLSIPVITLATTSAIPPRALMAWDRKLLSRSQHLTLLITGFRGVYPIPEGSGGGSSYGVAKNEAEIKFKVGLTKKYKPGKEQVAETWRTFGLTVDDFDDEHSLHSDDLSDDDSPPKGKGKEQEISTEEEGTLEKFSLSSSLESLLDHALIKIIHLRKKFGLGWAGSETLFSEVEKRQKTPEDVFGDMRTEIMAADEEEAILAITYNLPFDPLSGQDKTAECNLPLIAFCYLIRRLTLCTRYCPVCHNKINLKYETLKPYVCHSKLCSYQYYAFNRGPSIEYEICRNPETVDLLLSLTYAAAAEKVLDHPFPVGMGLRVPVPDMSTAFASVPPGMYMGYGYGVPPPPIQPRDVAPGPDGLCDFDDFDISQMRASIAQQIDSLPRIHEMKKHLERKVKAGSSQPKLKDMDPSILPAAWSILRWCVASCTADLEEITNEEDRIRNIDMSWRQFRFTVGAPDAEAKFKAAVAKAQEKNTNAQVYPSLYAFHGSPFRNWHSIIRHGLWYKTVSNGRSHGNGVYLAKDGAMSMGYSAQSVGVCWRNSAIGSASCVAVTEIVNLPNKFLCSQPFFVVKDTHWIMCRYLLVSSGPLPDQSLQRETEIAVPTSDIPLVKLDPAHPLTISQSGFSSGFSPGFSSITRQIEIPLPSYRLEKLLMERINEYEEEDMDAEDQAVFDIKPPQSLQEVIEIDDTPPPGENGSILCN